MRETPEPGTNMERMLEAGHWGISWIHAGICELRVWDSDESSRELCAAWRPTLQRAISVCATFGGAFPLICPPPTLGAHRMEGGDNESVNIDKVGDETRNILKMLGTDAAKEGARGHTRRKQRLTPWVVTPLSPVHHGIMAPLREADAHNSPWLPSLDVIS